MRAAFERVFSILCASSLARAACATDAAAAATVDGASFAIALARSESIGRALDLSLLTPTGTLQVVQPASLLFSRRSCSLFLGDDRRYSRVAHFFAPPILSVFCLGQIVGMRLVVVVVGMLKINSEIFASSSCCTWPSPIHLRLSSGRAPTAKSLQRAGCNLRYAQNPICASIWRRTP